MKNLAYKTAISRKSPSAPMKWLDANGKLFGWKLDYGCGKGYDADTFGMEKYDPHFFKCDDFSECEFDTITCNFVLNVIPDAKERQFVLDSIIRLLRAGGHAYVTIRADKSKLAGYTKSGTYQTYVTMPSDWTLIHKGSGYEMYEYIG